MKLLNSRGFGSSRLCKTLREGKFVSKSKRSFGKSEGLCSRTKFNKISSISHDSYRRHFGSWHEALVNFKKWLEDNKYDYPWITELPDSLPDEITEETKEKSEEADFKKQWKATSGNKYGSF